MAVERVELASADPPWGEEHMARYARAHAALPVGIRVLDLACGTGEGAALLASAGRHVLAMDRHGESVRRARRLLDRAGAGVVCDALRLPLADGAVDAVVSFETVEHLDAPGAFLREVARVLSPGGVLHLSTPNALVTNPGGGRPQNPFHVREFTPRELAGLLPPELRLTEHLGQGLPEAYGPAPFLPSYGVEDRTVASRLRALRWKLLLRLPRVRDPVHRTITGYPFHPLRDHYRFTPDRLSRAHVQYLVCRRHV